MILIRELVTVEILYELPDYSILNTFLWQTNDMVPEYPRIRKFLNYWDAHIEAEIREIQLAHSHKNGWRKVDWHGIQMS